MSAPSPSFDTIRRSLERAGAVPTVKRQGREYYRLKSGARVWISESEELVHWGVWLLLQQADSASARKSEGSEL